MRREQRGVFQKWRHKNKLRVAAFFVFTAFLHASVAWSAPIVPAVRDHLAVPSISDIHIPEEFGVVEEVYQSPNASGNSPLVIYIQDAHCIYEAQSNIRKIIDKVQKDNGLKLVALEGGSGKIDPLLFRAFPLQDVKVKVIDKYVQRGELSGAEYAAIVNERESDFYGIEDMQIYRENKDAFLKAIDEKNRVDINLDDIDRNLRKMMEEIYSPALKELFEKTEDYEKERLNLADYVNYLKRFEGISGKYPMIEALLSVVEREKAIDSKRVNEEIVFLVREIERVLKNSDENGLKAFHEKYSAYQREEVKRESFIPWLVAGAGGLDEKYPVLSDYAHHLAGMEKIKGEALFKEIDELNKAIKEKLFQNDREKRLDQLFHNLKILRNLSKLELSRDELAEYRGHPAGFEEKNFRTFIGREPVPMELDKLFEPHRAFYDAALKRDETLHANLMKLLNGQKRKFGMVITGGFHSDGIKEKLKHDGISYILIVPRITQFDEKTPYWDVMRGKVSYAKYLKKETLSPELFLVEYQKAAEEGLSGEFAEQVKENLPGILQGWKNNINARADISPAQKARYLGIIDRIFNQLIAEKEVIPAGETANIVRETAGILKSFYDSNKNLPAGKAASLGQEEKPAAQLGIDEEILSRALNDLRDGLRGQSERSKDAGNYLSLYLEYLGVQSGNIGTYKESESGRLLQVKDPTGPGEVQAFDEVVNSNVGVLLKSYKENPDALAFLLEEVRTTIASEEQRQRDIEKIEKLDTARVKIRNIQTKILQGKSIEPVKIDEVINLLIPMFDRTGSNLETLTNILMPGEDGKPKLTRDQTVMISDHLYPISYLNKLDPTFKLGDKFIEAQKSVIKKLAKSAKNPQGKYDYKFDVSGKKGVIFGLTKEQFDSFREDYIDGIVVELTALGKKDAQLKKILDNKDYGLLDPEKLKTYQKDLTAPTGERKVYREQTAFQTIDQINEIAALIPGLGMTNILELKNDTASEAKAFRLAKEIIPRLEDMLGQARSEKQQRVNKLDPKYYYRERIPQDVFFNYFNRRGPPKVGHFEGEIIKIRNALASGDDPDGKNSKELADLLNEALFFAERNPRDHNLCNEKFFPNAVHDLIHDKTGSLRHVTTIKGDEHFTVYRDTDGSFKYLFVDFDNYQAVDLMQRELGVLPDEDNTFFELHKKIDAILDGRLKEAKRIGLNLDPIDLQNALEDIVNQVGVVVDLDNPKTTIYFLARGIQIEEDWKRPEKFNGRSGNFIEVPLSRFKIDVTTKYPDRRRPIGQIDTVGFTASLTPGLNLSSGFSLEQIYDVLSKDLGIGSTAVDTLKSLGRKGELIVVGSGEYDAANQKAEAKNAVKKEILPKIQGLLSPDINTDTREVISQLIFNTVTGVHSNLDYVKTELTKLGVESGQVDNLLTQGKNFIAEEEIVRASSLGRVVETAAPVKKTFNPEAVLYWQAPDQVVLNAAVKNLTEAHQKVLEGYQGDLLPSAVIQYDGDTFKAVAADLPHLTGNLKQLGPKGRLILHFSSKDTVAINDILSKLPKELLSKIKKQVYPEELPQSDLERPARQAERSGKGTGIFVGPSNIEVLKKVLAGNKMMGDVNAIKRFQAMINLLNDFTVTLARIPKENEELRKKLLSDFASLGIEQKEDGHGGFFISINLEKLIARITTEYKAISAAKKAA